MPTVVYVVIWGCAVVALFIAMIAQWLALRQAPRNRIDSTGGWLTIFFDREAFRGKATRVPGMGDVYSRAICRALAHYVHAGGGVGFVNRIIAGLNCL